MSNTIEYKGYVGTVEFSQEDGVFFGKVMGLRALLSYEGSTAAELLDDFHGVVDDYLALCQAEGKEPERAFNQQSLNMEGLPFLASPENEAYMQAKAMRRFMEEVQQGWDSAEQEGWITEEDAYRSLAVPAPPQTSPAGGTPPSSAPRWRDG